MNEYETQNSRNTTTTRTRWCAEMFENVVRGVVEGSLTSRTHAQCYCSQWTQVVVVNGGKVLKRRCFLLTSFASSPAASASCCWSRRCPG